MPCPAPGPEEAALLQAIKDSDPVDQDVRQVYADWLLDQGREAHAHFVRFQKEHDDPFSAFQGPGLDTPEGRAARAFADEALREWVGEVAHHVNVQFRRGLLHAVIPMTTFLSGNYGPGLEACRRAGWVETIELIDVQDVHLRRLPYAMARPTERLALRSAELSPEGQALLADVPRLESVDLARGDVARLANVPGLRRLILTWWGQDYAEGDLAPLAGMGGLRSLSLEGYWALRDKWLAPLFALTGLRHLSITGTQCLTNVFLVELPALVNLRSLCITGTNGFSRKALDWLQQALPDCTIQASPGWPEDVPF
jgi:uncharacterized protein (TIGR02996 family)